MLMVYIILYDFVLVAIAGTVIRSARTQTPAICRMSGMSNTGAG
jgi:hypothetical protein